MITTNDELRDAVWRHQKLSAMRRDSWNMPIRDKEAGPREAELTRRILALKTEIDNYHATMKLLA